jgi:hypothetical protein
MTNAYETGTLFSANLPEGQRSYYEQLLLETLRMKSILVPYCAVKEDFAARDTGVIIFSEVMDTDPNFNALSESNIWLSGAHLDSRSVQIVLEIHGDTIKISDYNELVNYWANGDLRGLVKGKLGQNQVDYMDLLAREAFLSIDDTYITIQDNPGGDIYDLVQGDVFDPDNAELARIHLEEREIPGVQAVEDGSGATIVCTTTPRVAYDIRNQAGGQWLEVQEYAGSVRKFNSEVGMWGGVRFVKTNRLWLRNYGLVDHETTLSDNTVVGQGASATVDTVYSVGQTGSTRWVPVAASAAFSVGEYVTIVAAGEAGSDGAGGHPPVASAGSQETRRITALNSGGANRLTFDRPLMKPHSSGDYVVNGVDIHASIFHGGPAVVYGVGERPHPLVLPVIDDLGMVQRFSWRGFVAFQMFRPEFIEVFYTGGSVT